MYAAICPRVHKSSSMFFKNLPLSFSFAESTVLRLQVNCETFFVVILKGICLLALNIREKTLRENYSCNYKHQLKRGVWKNGKPESGIGTGIGTGTGSGTGTGTGMGRETSKKTGTTFTLT